MEDATKEFQIFMSPSRDFQQPYREVITTKHRKVPVINKILSSSSTSTFTLNQRKCSIYKAVSGVSFQDTDVEKKPTTRKRDKKKERRQSYAALIPDAEKKPQVLPPTSGTRRSRSLTSMESAMTISSDKKNLPEITHPFTPVMICNQSSGRKSRYSRVRDKKRSSSQVRNGTESKKHEISSSSLHKVEQQAPVRPRRARSASRSRKPLTLTSFPSDISLDSSLQDKNSLYLRCEQLFHQPSNTTQKTFSSQKYHDITTSSSTQRSKESSDIDFSVNESDWRKYDVLVTEKLDSLLKKKEEPEGGYFSLEREEAEDLERFTESGDHFQRDNSSETIYVAQTFSKENKICDIPDKYDQYTVEEIYSEVPFTGQGQEVGFVDDEGLYEEIFFDKSNDQTSTIFNNDYYEKTSPINILVSPDAQSSRSMPKSVCEVQFPKTEKCSSSTIVYIGGDDSSLDNSFDGPMQPSRPLKQSTSCTNLLYWPNHSNKNKQSKEKKLSVVDIVHEPNIFEGTSQGNNNVWCGCHSNPNFQSSHTSSCIRSRPGQLSSKYSIIGGNQNESNSNKDISDVHMPSHIEASITVLCKSSNTTVPETDYELSDIDLDMFAPKHLDISSHHYTENHMKRSSSEAHLNLQSFTPILFSKFSKSLKENLPQIDIISPKTFRGFLEDSIFNPPDTDSVTDDNADLFIEEDQIVTCITDTDSSSTSSSSDSEEEQISPVTSPWLEAKNEFEFLTFKEEKRKPLQIFRRKKSKKDFSSQKSFKIPFFSESSSQEDRFKESNARKNSEDRFTSESIESLG